MTKLSQAPFTELLQGQTAVGQGEAVQMSSTKARSVQASLTGVGAISATVAIYVSNFNDIGSVWLLAGTIILNGTTSVSDGFLLSSDAPWGFIRADVSAISGTGAEVDVRMGV